MEAITARFAHALALSRMGQMLRSAIKHGALLDQQDWGPWIEAVQKRIIIKDGIIALELGGNERVGHRRWIADPVTGLHILRWHTEGLTLRHPVEPLDCFSGCDEVARGEDASQLLERSISAWSLRLPGLLLAYARGQMVASSFPAATWERLVYDTQVPDAPAEPCVQENHKDAAAPLPEVYRAEFRIIRGQEQAAREGGARSIRAAKRRLASEISGLEPSSDALQSLLRKWIAHAALHERGRATKGYTPSTIRGHLGTLIRMLEGWTGCPLTASGAELGQFLDQRLQMSSASHRQKAVKALRSFLAFIDPLRDEPVAIDLDEYPWDETVAGEIILPKAYAALRKQLASEGAEGMADMVVLMFRAGLRLDEVAALKSGDVNIAGGMVELVVEENERRTLKTKTSRRIVPLDVLLEAEELKAMISRAQERQRLSPQGAEAWLFGPPLAYRPLSFKAVDEEITTALQKATGSNLVAVRHLRHSFASYLLATLMLPHGGEAQVPAGLTSVISQDRRERIADRLLGRERLGAGALHAVSQLLGHTGPWMTSKYYCHLLDMSLGQYCGRSSDLHGTERGEMLSLLRIAPASTKRAYHRGVHKVGRPKSVGAVGDAARPDMHAVLAHSFDGGRQYIEAQTIRDRVRRMSRPLARQMEAYFFEVSVPARTGAQSEAADARATGQHQERKGRRSAVSIEQPRRKLVGPHVQWPGVVARARAIEIDRSSTSNEQLLARWARIEAIEKGLPSVELRALVDRHLHLTRPVRQSERRALMEVVDRFGSGRTDIRIPRLQHASAIVSLLQAMNFKVGEIILSQTSRAGRRLSSTTLHQFLSDRGAAPALAGRTGWRGSLMVRVQPDGISNSVLGRRAVRFALITLAMDLVATEDRVKIFLPYENKDVHSRS